MATFEIKPVIRKVKKTRKSNPGSAGVTLAVLAAVGLIGVAGTVYYVRKRQAARYAEEFLSLEQATLDQLQELEDATAVVSKQKAETTPVVVPQPATPSKPAAPAVLPKVLPKAIPVTDPSALPYPKLSSLTFPSAPLTEVPRSSDYPSNVETRRGMIGPFIEAASVVNGFSPGFLTFAWAASKRESTWNLFASNQSASEAKAALKAYERVLTMKGAPMAGPQSHYAWGSGGWFGLLPASMMGKDPFRAVDPFPHLFEPGMHMAIYSAFIRRVISSVGSKIGEENVTWLKVRRAMRALSAAGIPDDQPDPYGTKDRLVADVQSVGGNVDWIYQRAAAANSVDLSTLATQIRKRVQGA